MPALNLISLDVPDPPDYGGAIDIYHKIRSLHAAGVEVHLHCFQYGRRVTDALRALCKTVHTYPRRVGWLSQLSTLPYIVYSRRSNRLLANLRANEFPILCEGLHCTYFLTQGDLADRTVMLRSHNVEHDYYRYLARRETNALKKLFFLKEAYLLQRLVDRLPRQLPVAAISPADSRTLQREFPRTFWLPPFHANDVVQAREGFGRYALYHGNLSVSENSASAYRLIDRFAGKDVPLVIAGKAPGRKLRERVKEVTGVRLVPDPEQAQMDELIADAHVILLLTDQPTGIKLKLIESLYRGRFCVANPCMVEGTGLAALTVPAGEDVYSTTAGLLDLAFDRKAIEHRGSVLREQYDNHRNALILLEKLGLSQGHGLADPVAQ